MAGQRRGFVAVSSPDGKGKKGLRPSLQVTIGTGQRCPYCHEHLTGDEGLAACAECLTVFHEGCVAEGGGCTTLGCAHARPELAQAPPAPREPSSAGAWRPRALLAVALLVSFVGLGLGAWGVLRPPHVIVEPPPPPPVALAPRIASFDAALVGDVLQVRAEVDGPPLTVGRFDRDAYFAARVNGTPVLLQPTGREVDGRGRYRVVADLPRSASLGLGAGLLPVELVVVSAGPTVSETRWVRVEPPPPPPVIVVERGPTLRLLAESIQTFDSMVDVRGTIDADGPVTITVRSAAGDVTWEAQPGPFYSTVTVGPNPGTQELVVRVRDRHGREAVALQRVIYTGVRSR